MMTCVFYLTWLLLMQMALTVSTMCHLVGLDQRWDGVQCDLVVRPTVKGPKVKNNLVSCSFSLENLQSKCDYKFKEQACGSFIVPSLSVMSWALLFYHPLRIMLKMLFTFHRPCWFYGNTWTNRQRRCPC